MSGERVKTSVVANHWRDDPVTDSSTNVGEVRLRVRGRLGGLHRAPRQAKRMG
jgi:hypothetical protein